MTEKQSLSIYYRCNRNAEVRFHENQTRWGMTEARALAHLEFDAQAAWLRHLERIRSPFTLAARERCEQLRMEVQR